jgi:hypothetical protein
VPTEAAALGLGHDMASAIHYDQAGNDTYAAPSLALGVAEDNGIAVFVNSGGTDTFHSPAACLGDAFMEDTLSDERKAVSTVAVFVKAGGASSYRVGGKDDDRAGKSWSSNKHNQYASGVDRPGGGVVIE